MWSRVLGKGVGWGRFDPPRSALRRSILIDGQRAARPNSAQAGRKKPGLGPGYGLGAGEWATLLGCKGKARASLALERVVGLLSARGCWATE
jgi:hypothetical protein